MVEWYKVRANMEKNILILYTNYGTGHYMAAKAISEYIKENYSEYNVIMFDPLSFSRPIINKIFAKTGNIVATKFRRFRGVLYKKKMYKNYTKNSFYFKFCIKLFWTKKLKNKLLEFNPRIIISTQVGPTGLVGWYKDLFNAKLISVFTDYGIHRMYTVAHEYVDLYCVPTNDIKEQMIDIGIDKKKLVVTGIPVRECFKANDNCDKLKVVEKYKLDINKPVFLFVCGGGLGIANAFKYFKELLKFDYDFSYIFVSGKNENLYKKAFDVSKMCNKNGVVLGYVEDMDLLIASSDLVFGKPGGILTSETLNLGVPICAIEPIPGQETNNASFVSINKFGFYISNIDEFIDFLGKLKTRTIELSNYKKNIAAKFNKFSFLDINKL